MCKISIIIPVYNCEKYLKDALDKIINQTFKEIEIILINDGSTDSSLSICKEYSSKDERIKVISKKNEGVSKARNIGIQQSVGEYIMFVDSDDWIETNMCELLYNKAITEDADVVFCNHIMEYDNRSEKINFENDENIILSDDIKNIILSLIEEEECHKDHNRASFRSPWGKLFKRNIILKNNISFNEKLAIGEDFIFDIEYLKFCNKMVIVNEYLYHYRMNNESAIQKYRVDIWANYKILLISLEKYLNENFNQVEYLNRLNKLKIKYLLNCLQNEANILNKKSFIEKKRYIINICEESIMKNTIMEYKSDITRKKEWLTLYLLRNRMYSLCVLWKCNKN